MFSWNNRMFQRSLVPSGFSIASIESTQQVNFHPKLSLSRYVRIINSVVIRILNFCNSLMVHYVCFRQAPIPKHKVLASDSQRTSWSNVNVSLKHHGRHTKAALSFSQFPCSSNNLHSMQHASRLEPYIDLISLIESIFHSFIPTSFCRLSSSVQSLFTTPWSSVASGTRTPLINHATLA